MAKGLTLEEIQKCRKNIPPDMGLKPLFTAPCAYLTGEDVFEQFHDRKRRNRGMARSPCRWKYALWNSNVPESIIRSKKDDQKHLCIMNSKRSAVGLSSAAQTQVSLPFKIMKNEELRVLQ